MNDQTFANEYDIIVCALALLLRQFENEDKWFAAQCIWWLVSIIQYTEILKYHLEYNPYPSVYLRDCIVTPLPRQEDKGDLVSELDIPELQLASDAVFRSQSIQREVAEAWSILPNNRRTRSGRIVKPVNRSNTKLRKRYPRKTQQQPKSIGASLKDDGSIH